jgi:hypothetical protein
MMRRTSTIATVGLILVLTGCGIVPGIGPDPRVDGVPVAGVTCPETYEDGYAQAGLVPAGFTAVAVLRCDPFASRQDDNKIWSGALLERLEGDLDPVIAAFATPSDPRSLGPCSAVGYVSPELWVEDGDGKVLRVAVPTDGCGAPKAVGLKGALDALTVMEEKFTPTTLIESSAAKGAGCATQAGMLIATGLDDVGGLATEAIAPEDEIVGEGALVPHEMSGWPDPATVVGARLCDYVTTPSSEHSPAGAGSETVFVGLRQLGTADARALITDARRAPATASCTDSATQLVVVHSIIESGDAAPFTVELDGCQRLIDPTFQARNASAAILLPLSFAG